MHPYVIERESKIKDTEGRSGGLPMPAYGCNSFPNHSEDREIHEIKKHSDLLDPDLESRC